MTEDEDDDNCECSVSDAKVLHDHSSYGKDRNLGSPLTGPSESPPWLPDTTWCILCPVGESEVCQNDSEYSSSTESLLAGVFTEISRPQSNNLNLLSEQSALGEKSQDFVKPIPEYIKDEKQVYQCEAEESFEERDATTNNTKPQLQGKNQRHKEHHSQNPFAACVNDSSDPGKIITAFEQSEENQESDDFTDVKSPFREFTPFCPVLSPSGYPALSPLQESSVSLTDERPVTKHLEDKRLQSNGNGNLHLPPNPKLLGSEHANVLEPDVHKQNIAGSPDKTPSHDLGGPTEALKSHESYSTGPTLPNSNPGVKLGASTLLLSYAVKYLILPKEVKLFNIKYYKQRSPHLFKHFIEFCGQSANGLTCSINTNGNCPCCTSWNNTIEHINILYQIPGCFVYNKEEQDTTHRDAILKVVSAGYGHVRLTPKCPEMWEQWAYYMTKVDGRCSCFIKAFSKHISPCRLPDIQQSFVCLQWPAQIADEYKERKRVNNWLDKDTLGNICKQECLVVPFEKASRNDIDWLLLFPKSERKLAERLTGEQLQCFFTFQIVIQHHIMSIADEKVSIGERLQVLLNLDHVLFHACDDIKEHMWMASLGYCFLTLVHTLVQFLQNKNLPHYIVQDRNLLQLSDYTYGRLEEAVREILKRPLHSFQTLVEKHKLENSWILRELILCNRLIGGHGMGINIERIFLSMTLQMSKKFMQIACPMQAFGCMEILQNEMAVSKTEDNNNCTTDIYGFFKQVLATEKDVRFLCLLSVYTKLSQCIDISSILPGKFTNLQDAVGSFHQLPWDVGELPFPTFSADDAKEKVHLLEEVALQLSQDDHHVKTAMELYECIVRIAASMIECLKADSALDQATSVDECYTCFAINASAEDAISSDAFSEETKVVGHGNVITRHRNTETSTITQSGGMSAETVASTDRTGTSDIMDGHTSKVVRSLLESQFRCLLNLFQCCGIMGCPAMFNQHLTELELICEQLDDPKMYKAFAAILRRLGHDSRAQLAEERAEIIDHVEFGVWRPDS